MSYGRDPDKATRGVGAIAAVDSSPARQRQRVAIGRGTRRRDRHMSAVANGALGAVGIGLPASWSQGIHATVVPNTASMRPVAIVAYPDPVQETVFSVPKPAPNQVTLSQITTGTTPIAATTPPIIASVTPTVVTSSSGTAPVYGLPGPVTQLTPIPDVPLDTDIDTTDNTVRNLLIAGGVGLGIYFLFGRKS